MQESREEGEPRERGVSAASDGFEKSGVCCALLPCDLITRLAAPCGTDVDDIGSLQIG